MAAHPVELAAALAHLHHEVDGHELLPVRVAERRRQQAAAVCGSLGPSGPASAADDPVGAQAAEVGEPDPLRLLVLALLVLPVAPSLLSPV